MAPTLFDGNCYWAWEYIRKLWGRHPVLQQLFALQSDFELGLASYSLLLSLIELAQEVTSSSPQSKQNLQNVRLDATPLFVHMEHETIAAAARRVSGNPAVVQNVAARFGADISKMKPLWPLWKELCSRYRSSERVWFGELTLGELAGP